MEAKKRELWKEGTMSERRQKTWNENEEREK